MVPNREVRQGRRGREEEGERKREGEGEDGWEEERDKGWDRGGSLGLQDSHCD